MGLLSDNPMWEAFGQRALLRAVYGGADFGECLTTVQRIGSGDAGDWHREWTATADRVAALGDAAAAKGNAVSAREAYLRAVTYYHASYFPLFGRPVDPRLVDASHRETATFRRAAALFDPPIEVLEIPFEGTTLPAYLVKADDSGAPRPTVLHTNGYDSNVQEMYFAHAPAATRRGYHCLLFDGPGQGHALIRDGLTMRPDWEHVVRPVVDYALSRPEVDPRRLVLAGWSFGGFLAPRAAAFEPRLAALIADPGQWDQRDILASLPLSPEDRARFPDVDPAVLTPFETWLKGDQADPLLRWRLLQRGLWVHGVDTLFDYLAAMTAFEISTVAGQITCPTLVTAAEGDPIAAGASRLYEALQVSRKALVRFTAAEGAGGHCESFARTLYHQRVFDWLDEVIDA
jgi:alpha-beta hydrolase superfamily lysophospholipase